MSLTFSESARPLVPVADTEESDFVRAFAELADLLLNYVTVQIAGHPHRLTEIEFYFNGYNHRDTFTHGDSMQEEFAKWYFHRTAGEYRSGTYKGLDIALGVSGAPFGVLVRGFQQLDDDKLLDGPCVCVDHILSLTGHDSIVSLVDDFDRSIDEPPSGDSPLFLRVESNSRNLKISDCPRVGLSLKRGASKARIKFIAAHYRFLTEPAKIKKGRVNLVLGLYAKGESAASIAQLTGSTLSQVQKWVSQFEAGKTMAADTFNKELNNEELCQLFGACQQHLPHRPLLTPAAPTVSQQSQGQLFPTTVTASATPAIDLPIDSVASREGPSTLKARTPIFEVYSPSAFPAQPIVSSQPVLYDTLASWWPLLSNPNEYEEEAAYIKNILAIALGNAPSSTLELGCGGGNLASHLNRWTKLSLVDVSAAMVEVSKKLNPQCEHVVGDMRTVNLKRSFDAVIIHDAIMYMTTQEDLIAALTTARKHLQKGVLLVLPDHVEETFSPQTKSGGHDSSDGRALRYLEWDHAPLRGTTTQITDYCIVLREADGTVSSILDRHKLGLFSRFTWRASFERAGFSQVHTLKDPWRNDIFLARPLVSTFDFSVLSQGTEAAMVGTVLFTNS